MKRVVFLLVSVVLAFGVVGQDKSKKIPPVVHSKVGQEFISNDNSLKITVLTKHQNHNWNDRTTLDSDILSPKSVNVHPNGLKYYVNSLEGCKTVVYDSKTDEKIKVINHKFGGKEASLWAKPSGLYTFNPERKSPNIFMGKPVESTFSHGGRYLWVPYYRRSYDQNAQEPSAIAIIDTTTDSIIKMMETGVLPKMVATSPDNKYVAVSHWGDNTVGIIDVSSANPEDWKSVKCVVVGYRLKLNFSENEKVDRDVHSGYCLRGTTFTPDSRYLFVGCMGGGGGLAVIDMKDIEYKGQIYGMMPNMRHIQIKDGIVNLSINNAGYIQRLPLQTLIDSIPNMKNKRITVKGWQSYKTGSGTRTLSVSPSGTFIFVACNFSSQLDVFRVSTMKKIASIPMDSYPVGLDISPNAKRVYVTSQGRSGHGGNSVNVLKIDYLQN